MKHKKNNKNKLALSIKKALFSLGGGMVLALPLSFVSAQEPEKQEEVEKIVVTGSLIRGSAGYEENSPIQMVGREDFEMFAADTITDIAKNLTVSGGAEFQNESGTLIGTSQFNIRGLGLGSSLTLINGRRGGVSAVADGGGNQFFDINQLPLAMIKRIDILTDGASATYGSQAVAGVANIITRKGFEGFEIDVKYQESSNDALTFNLATGAKSDKATFNVYATYRTNERNDRDDFGWLKERLGHVGDLSTSKLLSGTGQPGSYQLATADPTTGLLTGSSGSTIPDPDCLEAGGIQRRDEAGNVNDSRCRHTFFENVSVIPEMSAFQVFSEGSYFVNDKVELFLEGSFSQNRINRTNGPSLFSEGLAKGGNVLIPADHPFNFWTSDGDDSIQYVDPSQWDNSVHTPVPLRGILRPLGRSFNKSADREFDIDYWRGVIGFDAEVAEDWNLNASYMHASSRWTRESSFEWNATNINDFGARAVSAFGLTGGVWNPFGTAVTQPNLVSPKDGVSTAGNSAELSRSLWKVARDENEANQSVIDVVLTGIWGELEGGEIGWAFGYQSRQEDYRAQVDALTSSGSGARDQNFAIGDGISGEQKVNSYFMEAQMPVTDDLEIQLALRHESFDSGVSTTDPKIAARWTINDMLAVRGSYGTSFQAPSTSQKSTSNQAANIDDPASLNPTTGQLECFDRGNNNIVTVINQGSESLKPQTAESVALGLVLQPTSALNISFDFWQFDYTDLITPDEGGQAIVNNDCNDDGIANDPRIVRDPGGILRTITSSFINAGSVKTNGFDLAVDYDFDLGTIGSLRLGAKTTYVNSFDIQLSEGGETIDAVGSRNFLNPFRPTPEWKGNFNANWKKDGHRVNLFVRYIDGYWNDNNEVDVDSWTTVDLQYTYILDDFLGKETTFSVGANNLFDLDPPSIGDGVRPGYENTIHDVRGRQVYAKIKHSF